MLARLKFTQAARGETRVSLSVLTKAEVEAINPNYSVLSSNLSVATNPAPKFVRHDDIWKERSGFGSPTSITAFTKLARGRVADAASVLEEEYGKDVLFTTLTLTGQTDESKDALARWSGWAVEKLKKWLHRNAPSALTVGVWERQKRGALHLHLVTGCSDPYEYFRIWTGITDYWIDLERQISIKTGVNLFVNEKGYNLEVRPDLWRNECVRVRKSVRRYVSKYASKDASKRSNPWHAPLKVPHYPSRWWFVDNRLRQLVNARAFTKTSYAMTFEESQEALSEILGDVIPLASKVVYYRNPEKHFDVTFVLFTDTVEQAESVRSKSTQHIAFWQLRTVTKEKPEGLQTPSGFSEMKRTIRSRYLSNRWSNYEKMVS